jgi:hypothetical protein
MAEHKNISLSVEETINRFADHAARGDVVLAHETLVRARAAARSAGNRKDELRLTSVIATYLAGQGRNDEALAECLVAEALGSSAPSLKAATAQQMFRCGRREEAAEIAKKTLALSGLQAGERHLLLTLLGEIAISEEPQRASDYLRRALTEAESADLEPIYWDLRLAEALCSRGDNVANNYLQLLRARAAASGEPELAEQIARILHSREDTR